MTLSSETEARGLKAYEQARAFERLRSWRLPAMYGIFALIPTLMAVIFLLTGHAGIAPWSFPMTGLCVLGAWQHWRKLKALYAANRQMLAELERTHGDGLPWIKVEKHLAALEELKRELAGPREKRRDSIK